MAAENKPTQKLETSGIKHSIRGEDAWALTWMEYMMILKQRTAKVLPSHREWLSKCLAGAETRREKKKKKKREEEEETFISPALGEKLHIAASGIIDENKNMDRINSKIKN